MPWNAILPYLPLVSISPINNTSSSTAPSHAKNSSLKAQQTESTLCFILANRSRANSHNSPSLTTTKSALFTSGGRLAQPAHPLWLHSIIQSPAINLCPLLRRKQVKPSQQLQTHDDDVLHPTFQDAARAVGIVRNNLEHHVCLQQAVIF